MLFNFHHQKNILLMGIFKGFKLPSAVEIEGSSSNRFTIKKSFIRPLDAKNVRN